MKVEFFKGYWTPEIVQKNKQYMFIYGDNDKHFGKKGQAIIRNEINAFGIPTKKYPSFNLNSYYTDDEFERNKLNINEAIDNIKTHLFLYEGIILPEDGLGTGLADLPNKAPRTYLYLQEQIKSLKLFVENVGSKNK